MSRRQPRTLLMQLIEERHAGEPIEALMLAAFATHGNERAAAQALGITQQAFNQWKFRLGLEEPMLDIARRASARRLATPLHLRDQE